MLNRVTLVGRLTRDPELRKTTSGTSVASFSIAVDDDYRGPNGERATIFMNCSCFGNRGETVAKYTRKGSLVSVDGRLTQRKYTRRSDNVEITTTEIVCDHVNFLDSRNAQSQNNTSNNSGYMPDRNADVSLSDTSRDDDNLDSIDVVDDDLPF